MPDAPPPPTSRLKTFLRRLLSTVILWAVILTALFCGNQYISDYAFLIVMVLLAVTGLAEFYGMAAKRDLVCFRGWGILGGAL